MSAKKIVLENQHGEVVRQLYWHGEGFSVVYRYDLHRVDFVEDIKDLEDAGIRFEVLKSVRASSSFAGMARPVELENGSRVKVLSDIDKVQAAPSFPEDKNEDVTKVFKWTAITQLSTIAIVMFVGLIIEPWLFKAPEEPIVTVVQQQEIPPPPPEKKKPTPTVEMKKKPIEQKIVKPIIKKRGPVTKMSKQIHLEKMGAIGALGGMKNGSTQSAGFNPNSFTNSRGTSTTANGDTGTGSKYAGQGAGLFQAAKGGSEGITGAGGYSTKGKAGGGRAGYGAMNTGGSASKYFQPVDEEAALVDGGLDRDQIAAVINRHLGQIIYCYEKGLQVNAKLNGRVGVSFVIGPQGIVSTARTSSTSLNSPTVESCIVSKLKTWVFPKPVGGVNVKVTYPFVLRRVNQG